MRTPAMLRMMSPEVDFAFSRSFLVGGRRDAQAALARQLRSDPTLAFVVVNESPDGRHFTEVGTAQVDWRELRDGGDAVDRELAVLDERGGRIGSLVVTVVAQGVLRALPA